MTDNRGTRCSVELAQVGSWYYAYHSEARLYMTDVLAQNE